MSVEIVQGTNRKPAASEELVKIIRNQPDLSGQLFIGFPVIGTSDGAFTIDALLVSQDKGITIFDLLKAQPMWTTLNSVRMTPPTSLNLS